MDKDKIKNTVHIVDDLTNLELSCIQSNMIILFDDCFEKWFYLPDRKATDQMIITDVLEKAKGCINTCLLLTLRKCTKEVFHSTLQLTFGQHMTVLDFEEMENRLTIDEAQSILSIYADYYGTAFYKKRKGDEKKPLKDNKEMMRKIVANSVRFLTTVGKAEALEIMCLKFDSLHKEDQFFRYPLEYLKRELTRMKYSSVLEEKWEFCSLILCFTEGWVCLKFYSRLLIIFKNNSRV